MKFFAIASVIAGLAASASAQVGVWSATPANGGEAVVGAIDALGPIDAGELSAKVGGEDVAAVRLLQLVPIRTGGPGGRFRLHLNNGDILRGEVAAIDDAGITMRTTYLGDVRVPLERAVALRAFSENGIGAPATDGDRPLSDEVRLANGDRVSGFLVGFENGELTVQQDDGAEITLPLDAVERVAFADPGELPAEEAGGAKIVLSDWTTLSVATAQVLESGAWEIAYNNATARVAPADILAVESAARGRVWLADQPAADVAQTPYFAASFPLSRAAGLESVVAANARLGRVPGRSIEVRSRSAVTFDVPPDEWTRLRVGYRIGRDGEALPQADVDLRILLDGEPAAEQIGVAQADGPGAFDVPLGDAATLTLLVDYGQRLDVQDQLVWIEPVLIRDAE